MARFKDRSEAGQRLAEQLSFTSENPPVVLALLRGGVPVAEPIARRLNALFDVMAVKKISAPLNPEIAIGAVAGEGPAHWNEKLIATLNVDQKTCAKWADQKSQEARRQIDFFRARLPAVPLRGRDVVVVDDGLATGATLEAALHELRRQGVAKITVAVPVAAAGSVHRLRTEVESVITLATPRNFRSVGDFYEDFSPVSDEEARTLLEKAQPRRAFEGEIERLARPLDRDSQLGVWAEHIASARIVVLGHGVAGTRELEHLRRKLSQILIQDHGFNLVAMDAEPGVAQELNKWVRAGRPVSTHELITKFSHWPRWLYANEETSTLIEPMHKHKAEFFGLDVYAFFQAMTEIRQLRRAGKTSKEIIAALGALLDSRMIRMGLGTPELFDLKHNLRLIAGADAYYAQLLEESPDLHALRDQHLLETLQVLLKNKGASAKAIVWAQDLHAGDSSARADLDRRPSLGHLLRERFGPENVCLIGMTAGAGRRLVAQDWGESEAEVAWSSPRLEEIESKLHAVAQQRNWAQLGLMFDAKSRQGPLTERRSQRLGSVIENESPARHGTIATSLSLGYDAFIYVDRCQPLQSRAPRQLAFEQVLSKHSNRRIKPEDRPSRAK